MAALPTEAYYDLTTFVDATVSPDGERVAFVTREFDRDEDEPVNSLWVVPASGERDPYRLTRVSDASSPKWGPDSAQLAFVATREPDTALRVESEADDDAEGSDGDAADGTDGDDADEDEDGEGGGDADPEPQVWVFDMDRGGDARQVTTFDEGVQGYDWGPDGERIVASARDPDEDDEVEQERLEHRREDGFVEIERLQHKYEGEGYLDEVTAYLFVVEVDTREQRRLDRANDGGYGVTGGLEPAWGAAGENRPDGRIAFTANHTDWPDDNDVSDVYILDPAEDDPVPDKLTDGGFMSDVLPDGDDPGGGFAASTPTWGPDGEQLAFTANPPDVDPHNMYVPTEVYVADVDAGGGERVTGGLDRTVARRGGVAWLDAETLVGLFGDEGRTRLVQMDADGGAQRVFERQADRESLGSLGVGGGTLAFTVASPRDGVDLHAIDASDLKAGQGGNDPRTRLTASNDDLLDEYDHDVTGPRCHRIDFESADGEEIDGIVYAPEDFDPEDPEPRKTILDVHGGPMAYDEPTFAFQDWYFTSRGYVVLKVNYRGSTSYGRDFCETLKGEWGGKEVEDLFAGVDELVDRGWADADDLYATGFSQGGVITAYLVTREHRWDHDWVAAAAEHGVYDYRACFGTDDAHNWWESDYGLPWENPDGYEAASSIPDVGNVETPLLVTAGEDDQRCPLGQAEQLYVSVRKQGVDAKLVVYRDEHHDVGDPDRAIHRLEELRDWF